VAFHPRDRAEDPLVTDVAGAKLVRYHALAGRVPVANAHTIIIRRRLRPQRTM
jgi:hypothetical protein